jgi:hypothetical protein
MDYTPFLRHILLYKATAKRSPGRPRKRYVRFEKPQLTMKYKKKKKKKKTILERPGMRVCHHVVHATTLGDVASQKETNCI